MVDRPNVYAYVQNNPVNYVDSQGTLSIAPWFQPSGWTNGQLLRAEGGVSEIKPTGEKGKKQKEEKGRKPPSKDRQDKLDDLEDISRAQEIARKRKQGRKIERINKSIQRALKGQFRPQDFF